MLTRAKATRLFHDLAHAGYKVELICEPDRREKLSLEARTAGRIYSETFDRARLDELHAIADKHGAAALIGSDRLGLVCRFD